MIFLIIVDCNGINEGCWLFKCLENCFWLCHEPNHFHSVFESHLATGMVNIDWFIILK